VAEGHGHPLVKNKQTSQIKTWKALISLDFHENGPMFDKFMNHHQYTMQDIAKFPNMGSFNKFKLSQEWTYL
jgi:hypothetical protein